MRLDVGMQTVISVEALFSKLPETGIILHIDTHTHTQRQMLAEV